MIKIEEMCIFLLTLTGRNESGDMREGRLFCKGGEINWMWRVNRVI